MPIIAILATLSLFKVVFATPPTSPGSITVPRLPKDFFGHFTLLPNQRSPDLDELCRLEKVFEDVPESTEYFIMVDLWSDTYCDYKDNSFWAVCMGENGDHSYFSEDRKFNCHPDEVCVTVYKKTGLPVGPQPWDFRYTGNQYSIICQKQEEEVQPKVSFLRLIWDKALGAIGFKRAQEQIDGPSSSQSTALSRQGPSQGRHKRQRVQMIGSAQVLGNVQGTSFEIEWLKGKKGEPESNYEIVQSHKYLDKGKVAPTLNQLSYTAFQDNITRFLTRVTFMKPNGQSILFRTIWVYL